MTDTERAKRLHDLLYSCESRDEMCERLVKLEELVDELYLLANYGAMDGELDHAHDLMRELGVEWAK